MAIQMYFVAIRGGFSQDVSRDFQHFVRKLGGYILMVTRQGWIIWLDDRLKNQVAAHSGVASIGGVNLNPQGRAVDRLTRIFAENLSKQLDIVVTPRENT